MENLLSFLTRNGPELLEAAAMIIAGASILANFTKTDKDDKALDMASKVINFLAANFFVLKEKK